MKLQVLSILPRKPNNTFQVVIKMDQEQHQFTMAVETDKLCNQPLHIVQGDNQFHSLFQWNRELAQTIYELVNNVYCQENINFPVSLGDFNFVEEPAINY